MANVKPTVVLVHGGFVDGAGWEGVYGILRKDGYVLLWSPILPPQDGFLFLDKAKFAASFAADVEPGKTAFMADSQVPWGVAALEGAASEPAWKTKPSWYLVATDDRMIPPAAQRFMSKRAGAKVVESAGSHAIYVSRPDRCFTYQDGCPSVMEASATADGTPAGMSDEGPATRIRSRTGYASARPHVPESRTCGPLSEVKLSLNGSRPAGI
jgi:hypothetical protein